MQCFFRFDEWLSLICLADLNILTNFLMKIILSISINYSTIKFFFIIEFIMQMLNNSKSIFHEVNDSLHEYIFTVSSKKIMILYFVSQNFVLERIKFLDDHSRRFFHVEKIRSYFFVFLTVIFIFCQ